MYGGAIEKKKNHTMMIKSNCIYEYDSLEIMDEFKMTALTTTGAWLAGDCDSGTEDPDGRMYVPE
jgi:hypothetical protein